MLKSQNRSSPKHSKARAKSAPRKKPVKLTPEQEARLLAFRQFVKDKQSAWDALSEAQKNEETESWKRIMDRMNDDRKGYRPVFVDP
jgi:hypothetical protein